MCPLCLTTLLVTVATSIGGGAAATAFAVRVIRPLRPLPDPQPQSNDAPKGTIDEPQLETHRQP
jgi:hypothetical protein